MSDEDNKKAGFVAGDHHHQYGTFQGVANFPPPRPPPQHQPAIGFPQPVPPPGATGEPSAPHADYYARGYQAVPGTLTNSSFSLVV